MGTNTTIPSASQTPESTPSRSSLLLAETPISFAQGARLLPPGRQGRPVSPVTIYRWTKNGVRRPDGTTVKLESVRVGGRWLTSVEALARFSERLSLPPDSDNPAAFSPNHRTPTQRQRASERAATELEHKGM